MNSETQTGRNSELDQQLTDWLSPLFLGAYAENNELFEKVLVELLRDHFYWRRNIHPEDRPQIPVLADTGPEYRRFVGKMKTELHSLTARLKNSAPFFSPRYIGHMGSDLLLPGLIAQLVTTLYNPNHVTHEAAPVTLPLELEMGQQLAAMFGFNTDPAHEPCAWGHATSGGTIANNEGLWYFRAVRYWPLAAAQAMRAAGFDPGPLRHGPTSFVDANDWTLFNQPIDTVINMRRELFAAMDARLDRRQARQLAECIESERIEHLGIAEFHARHPDFGSPVVLVADTAHYSWEKALKLLGLGGAQLKSVALNERMRMDENALEERLAELHGKRRPVLAVIGILGTTEFGSIDPVHEIIAARQRWRRRGLEFAVHVDAAWGGYLASMFRAADGSLLERDDMTRHFERFPTPRVYQAFAALRLVDSITVDPHKLGYVPFGCGAYVARNRGMMDFISQRAAYVFDDPESIPDSEYERRFRNLGQYILEGSKPGAAPAGAWLSHRVLPLDADNFGRLCAETVRNCEYFFDLIEQLRERLDGIARVVVPFQPDTNLVCLAINPAGNRSLGRMNKFGRRLYDNLSVAEGVAIHDRQFFGSRTLVHRQTVVDAAAERIMTELNLDPSTFVADPDDRGDQADSIFLLRHTLMNPWLSGRDQGQSYLDRYAQYLAGLVRRELGTI